MRKSVLAHCRWRGGVDKPLFAQCLGVYAPIIGKSLSESPFEASRSWGFLYNAVFDLEKPRRAK